MPKSSLPSVASRQSELVQRIQEAEQQGREPEALLIRSQLVHRFGIEALKELEPSEALPERVDEPVQSAGLLERVNAKLHSSGVKTRAAIAAAETTSAPTRTPTLRTPSLSTPPLSTPRSLRRWLPGTDSAIDRLAS